MKMRAEPNEIETTEITHTHNINETKSWFFEKINKIDRLLARLTKKRREKIQITSLRNETGGPGAVGQACNPSTLGGRSRRIT